MGHYLLVTGDFVKTGGMDRANYALASYLARRGDRVELVAHRAADDLLAFPNVALHRVPKPLGSYLLGERRMDREGRRHAARVAEAGGRVIVNGGNCIWDDANWVHHVHAADSPWPAGSALKRAKDRLAYRMHLAAERRAIPRARVAITGCEKSRRDVIERIGFPADRIQAVYYGVDSTLFRPADPAERAAIRARLGWPEGRPKVAFVGALGDRRKGFDLLFAAWQDLCRDPAWDADLVVVGRGAEADAWKARAAAAGLAGRIEFLGFVKDLPDLFRASDAHCLPSRYEGYSLVTQEALACGVPAFITTASGIAERYPEALRDLLIPDPEDVAGLVARLRTWRDRRAAWAPAVAEFGATIRAQSWDAMAAQVVAHVDAAG